MTPGLRERRGGGDGVVQRRRSARPYAREPGRDPLTVRRPVFDELGLVVEAIQKHFVVGPEQLEEKAIERLPGRDPFLAFHAAARVDDEPQAHRYALVVEVRDLLFLAILEQTKVLLPQTGHETAARVRNGCRHVDELHAGAEAEDLGLLRLLAARRHDQRGAERSDNRRRLPAAAVHDAPRCLAAMASLRAMVAAFRRSM